MPKKEDNRKKIQTLHSVDSFGIQEVSLSGIRVERLEDRVRPKVPFPHRHDFFQIMLMIKGKGKHQIDFRNYIVETGQLYLMKPGQMHSWELKSGVRGYIIEFNYQSLNAIKDSSRLIKDFTFSPDLFLIKNKEDFDHIARMVQIMLRESITKLEMHDLSLQGHLTSFLINIIRLYQSHLKQEKVLSTIERFRDLLEINFKSAHSVDFYAKELKTTSKALTMQLSRSIGRPPRKIIQERILLEAKRFLAFSDLGIAEIGYELGFEDANYFTRFFRLHEKITPAQFRKVAITPKEV